MLSHTAGASSSSISSGSSKSAGAASRAGAGLGNGTAITSTTAHRASLLPYMESLELYRQNAKKSNDPIVQWEFTKYLIETAESIELPSSLQRGGGDESGGKAYLMKEALLGEGVKWLKKLTQGTGVGRGGLPEAQFLLAECYGAGRWGVSVDHEKAFALYVQASKQSHPEATYRAAVCYEMGAGTKKDAARAVQFYRKAAALSEPASMYRLAMILLEGSMGVVRNEREGITWLKRAAAVADEAHPESLHELGSCFERQGMPSIIPDENYSWELYIKAAQLGYAPSQYKLGHCYEYGTLGRTTDPKRSIAWYTKAAEQGEAEAELALSGWYLTGADAVLAQSDREAYAWARKAADQELAKAEYAVGYYSEVGIGIQQDLDEARRWYMRAAAQGNKRAMQRLQELKKLGKTQKRNNNGKQDKNSSDCVIF